MMRRNIKMLFLLIIVFSLTGCWDYIGLNEITIVSGIAIDKDSKNNKYNLTFEFVDLSSSAKEKTISTKLIETTGSTIFDAVRNAKKKVMNKLYFSNAEVIVISEDIAKKEGINSVINWFVRDAEIRENINVIISKTGKAKDLFESSTVDASSAAFEIKKIVESDKVVTSSTKSMELFRAYNTLETPTMSLALPSFDNTKNDSKKTAEVVGIATFKSDKLIGYLNSTESKYFLFIDNGIEGGILTLKYDTKSDTRDNVSLEISNNITTKSFSYKDNKLKIKVSTMTKVFLGEFDEQDKMLDAKTINNIQNAAEAMLKKNMLKVIAKAKNDFKHDIFGFSDIVYERNYQLWKKIKNDWDQVFLNADIEIIPKVQITNSALLK